MANEFKVKKGLIVDGTNTVLDIQGTQGQLFSVTDSLTGDLFSVSDVSGIPILNVNSSGTVEVDGTLNVNSSSTLVIDGTVDSNIVMPTAGDQIRIGSFTNGSSNSGEYANDDLVIGDGSISIYPHRRGDYGLNESTATSTTFRSKLNIWSDAEDHITFGGANTHMVTAWEEFKIWINNDSASAGTLHLYNKTSKTEFAKFSGDGTSSFITGKFFVNGELEATSLDINGNADISGGVTITTTNSPGLKISKDRSTDNRFLRLNDTGTSGKDFDIINNGGLLFYNHTDSSDLLAITSSGNATFTGSVNVKTDKVQIDQDGTYGSGYGTVGFGGKANGYNRVFGNTGTADGLFLASATGRGVFIRVNGAATDAHSFGSNGYVGMGIVNTSNQRLTLAEADSNGSHIKMNNSRSGGGYWVVGVGDTNSNSSIVDPGGLFFYNGATRLKFNSSGNATFAGDITVNGGDVTIAKQNDAPTMTLLHDGTNPTTNDLLFKMQFQSDYNGSHQNWGKIELDTNASSVRTNMDFYVKSTSGNEELALRLEGQGSAVPNATFAGNVQATYYKATAGGNIALGNIGGIARIQNDGNGQLKMLSSGDALIGTFTSSSASFPGAVIATGAVQVPYAAATKKPMIVLNGATNYGLFHTEASSDIFSFDFNGVSKHEFKQDGSATFAGTGIFEGGGNTLTLKKGTGTPALAFAGTATDPQASALIEGVAGGGLKIYTSNGGTISTPGWSSKFTIAAAGNATFAGNASFATTQAPAAKIQAGAKTFGGGNGVHADSRLGIMNNGNLTSIVNASTYNDATYPDYGLVFIQGPSTSNYNVWSLSPDGPAKGSDLNFIFKANTTNIHTQAPVLKLHGSTSSATLMGDLNIDSSSASGSTILDVQGTAGQLFSVTNSLTGDLFSVSDVSGIPIFNVNSSGLSTFDGDIKTDGAVENNGITTYNTPAGGVAFNLDAAADNYGTFRLRTNANANKWDVGMKNDNDFYIYNQATSAQAFEIDTANNIATFSATTKSTRFTSTTTSGLHFSNYTGSHGWQIGSDSTAAGMYIYYENGTYAMKLTSGGNATFAGDINTSGDVHIDEGSTSAFQTTNKLRFGHTSWNNNIGIESYWMVLGCNQNEGFKFRDSTSNMLLQLQGGNSTSGNGAFSATFAGTISAVGASTFTLNDGIFIKAINGTNNVAATNVWGYGLYEGASKLGEISLVRDGTASQMYIGTTGANQVLRIGSANKVTALTIDASQNATFAGSVTAAGDVVAYSDKKLKKNIKTLDGSKVYDMRGVGFTRKDNGNESSGVIAQEIQKIAPELISETDGTLGVAYGNLTGYLIEAVKELKTEIEELKKQINNG